MGFETHAALLAYWRERRELLHESRATLHGENAHRTASSCSCDGSKTSTCFRSAAEQQANGGDVSRCVDRHRPRRVRPRNPRRSGDLGKVTRMTQTTAKGPAPRRKPTPRGRATPLKTAKAALAQRVRDLERENAYFEKRNDRPYVKKGGWGGRRRGAGRPRRKPLVVRQEDIRLKIFVRN